MPAAEEHAMSASQLSLDVYVAPMRPYNCPDQLGEGEVATWAPSSSTLISGPTEGILIDALLTFEHADQIAKWAKSFGKNAISEDAVSDLRNIANRFPGAIMIVSSLREISDYTRNELQRLERLVRERVPADLGE